MVLGLTAITGILQGGGFGLGYGFGVRAGYDAYGWMKKTLIEKATTARYSSNPFMSHLGSGILSALGLKDPAELQKKRPLSLGEFNP